MFKNRIEEKSEIELEWYNSKSESSHDTEYRIHYTVYG